MDIKNVVDNLMNLVIEYQNNSHDAQNLLMQLYRVRWWEFNKRRLLKQEIALHFLKYKAENSYETLFRKLRESVSDDKKN